MLYLVIYSIIKPVFRTIVAPMSIETSILSKLDQLFKPDHLEVFNESSGHNVPRNAETHFKVVMVSRVFEGERLIRRHRMVHEALAVELESGVHALSVHTYTDEEWKDRFGNAPMSPACLHSAE